MTISDDTVHALLSRFIAPLDWMSASSIVNEALTPLLFINQLVDKALQVPVLGGTLIAVFGTFVVIEALLGALLTVALMFGSLLLYVLVAYIGLSVADFANAVTHFHHLVCGC